MKKYPVVPLGEICEFTYGDSLKETNRKGGNVPVYGSNGIVGWHDEAITKGETIIIGRKGSIGEIHLSKVPCWAIDTTYYVEKTKVPCDFTWLYYMLKALDLTRLNKSAAVPGLNREDAYEQKLPLPPLDEQKRIASLLARADRLRQLRRHARRLADSLLQSVFLEMFGDGFGKWKVDLLENLTDKIDYGVTASAVLKPVGPKFLRITDIQEGKVNWDDVPYCEISEKERNASLLSKGDIVFARTGATTGKSFLIQECPENSVFASYLIRVRPAKELNPVFLFGYFQTAQYWKQISESATGSTQPGVNSTKLGELKIPLPPLPLQEEFARAAARVEGLRARQAEAERQAEGLFQSLLAESFTPPQPSPNPQDLGRVSEGREG